VSSDIGIGRRILLVEDDQLTRSLLAEMLESSGFVVATAPAAADARRAFRLLDPDALVLDVDLGPGPTGFDVAGALLASSPHLAVLFLTNLPDSRFAGRAPDSLPPGVGYVRKEKLTSSGVLVEALDAVLRENSAAIPRDDLDPQRPMGGLSGTQIAVLRMVALGMSNEQISEARGTSSRAVRNVITRALALIGSTEDAEGSGRVAAARNYMLTAGIPLSEL